MIVDLPDTTTTELSKRLVKIRSEVGAMALSRVLTLVVVVDDVEAEEAITIANEASRQHPVESASSCRASPAGAPASTARSGWAAMRAPARWSWPDWWAESSPTRTAS